MPSPIDLKTLVNVEMGFLYKFIGKVASRKFNSERKYEEKPFVCHFVSLQSCPDYP